MEPLAPPSLLGTLHRAILLSFKLSYGGVGCLWSIAVVTMPVKIASLFLLYILFCSATKPTQIAKSFVFRTIDTLLLADHSPLVLSCKRKCKRSRLLEPMTRSS